MPRFPAVAWIFVVIALAGGSAHAQIHVAALSGAAAQPPNASPGTGSVRALLNPAARALQLEIAFTGLVGTTTQAHVRCCVAAPGVAPIAVQAPTLDRFPTGVSAGTHVQLLDLAAAASFDPAFIAANGGTVAGADAALRAGLANGQAYVEIRTSAFAAGEIRGFLVPSDTLFGDGFESPAVALSLLRCDSPAEGALVDVVPGNAVAVGGTALGLTQVAVDGTPVTLAADRTFATTILGRYGLNQATLSGIDASGTTRSALCAFVGSPLWVAEGAQYFDALRFRLEPVGFTKLKSTIPNYFSPASLSQRLEPALLSGNPLYSASCGPVGTCVREIRHLNLGPLTNSVTLQTLNTSTLQLAFLLDVTLHERVRTQTVGAQDTRDGDVLFDNVTPNATTVFGIEPATGVPQALAGNVNFFGGTTTAQFAGMDPQFFASIVAESTSALASRLLPDMSDGLTRLFAGLFAGMQVPLPPAGYPVPRVDGSGNVTVVHARRSSVGLLAGGLTLGNSLRITTPAPPASASGRFPVPAPQPSLSRPADGWSFVNAGVFNQVNQALWRAGAFNGVVDGSALDPGLPAGTSLILQLRAQPVLVRFETDGTTRMDFGPLDLVATHPQLPPWLRATVTARVRAQLSLQSGDAVFSAFAIDELRITTGSVVLDAPSQLVLADLATKAMTRLAGIALNDSLPVLPATRFEILPSLVPYGFTAGTQLIPSPAFAISNDFLFLEGVLGP